jgi:hypothetical protein
MTPANSHRLDGLEPDNLLAFLALLGLLRALEADDKRRPATDRTRPRAAWDTEAPPLRPKLLLGRPIEPDDVAARAHAGTAKLCEAYTFDRKNLDYPAKACRESLETAANSSCVGDRDRADLLAALMSDAAVKEKSDAVDPTPLCLLFGQGHQDFLERLGDVPRSGAPEDLERALFHPWCREDDLTSSFRWDAEEAIRYALRAGDPTDSRYKAGTQRGANRLAAIGLAALPVVPESRAGRVRPAVIGDASGRDGFSFAWPIWSDPASLHAVRAMLAHPGLRTRGALDHLGVTQVLVAQRISVGKFMNFSRARPI